MLYTARKHITKRNRHRDRERKNIHALLWGSVILGKNLTVNGIFRAYLINHYKGFKHNER